MGGKCDDKAKHLLMTAYKCLQKGIEQVKPGSRYRDIGEEVTKLATRRNCSVVKAGGAPSSIHASIRSTDPTDLRGFCFTEYFMTHAPQLFSFFCFEPFTTSKTFVTV